VIRIGSTPTTRTATTEETDMTFHLTAKGARRIMDATGNTEAQVRAAAEEQGWTVDPQPSICGVTVQPDGSGRGLPCVIGGDVHLASACPGNDLAQHGSAQPLDGPLDYAEEMRRMDAEEANGVCGDHDRPRPCQECR
jgi:hypothetical protein